jgi:hypothetical protein
MSHLGCAGMCEKRGGKFFRALPPEHRACPAKPTISVRQARIRGVVFRTDANDYY